MYTPEVSQTGSFPTRVSPGKPHPFVQNRNSPRQASFSREQWRSPRKEDTSTFSQPDWVQGQPQLLHPTDPQENYSPKSQPSVSSPTTPGSGRRWGFFSSKKKDKKEDNDSTHKRLVSKKLDTLLKKPSKSKSTPDLTEFARYGEPNASAPFPRIVVQPPALPPLPQLIPAAVDTAETDPSIYLTIDPNWDESQGAATVYFIPPPDEYRSLVPKYSCDGKPSRAAHTPARAESRQGQTTRPMGESNSFLYL